MICPRCGTINPEDGERCTRCKGSLAPPPPREGSVGVPVEASGAAEAVGPTDSPWSSAEGADPPPPVPRTPADRVVGITWGPVSPSAPGGGTTGSPGSPPAGAGAPPPGPPAWVSSGSPPPSTGWAPPPPGSRPLSPGWGPPTDNRSQPGQRAPRPAGTAVPNYLVWAIVCTIFFFTVAGAVGIVFSIMANRRASSGDLDGAFRASRTAKTWCWVSLIMGLVAYLLLATGALHMPTRA